MSKKLFALLVLVGALTGLLGTQAAQAEVADGWDYRALTLNGTYTPLRGQFAGDGATDILWYAPGSAPDSLWIGKVGQRGSNAFTKVNLTINGTYTPVVGDFFGDDYTDIIWYAPGTAADSAWVSADVPEIFTKRSLSVNGTFRVNVLADYSAPDRKDDILWYAPGTAPDFVWHFAESGSGSYSTVNLSINGTFQRIVGDWNGDGREDLVLYRPGTAADYRWASKTDGSFSQTSLTINGTYEPVTVYLETNDGILWWADGSAKDAYWVPAGTGFTSYDVTAPPYNASVYSAGIGQAFAVVADDGDGQFGGDATGGGWGPLAGEAHDKTTQKPIVGNFDGDDYVDVVWYGAGSVSDELWYTDVSAMGASPDGAATTAGVLPADRFPEAR